MADAEYRRLTPACFCGEAVPQRQGAGRKAIYCGQRCRDRFKPSARCEHPKPRLKNGRERAQCFGCKPKIVSKQAPSRSKVCAACGSPFTAKLESARFCGQKCRNKVNARRIQERRRDGSPRPCRWCAKVYVPEYGSLRRSYCSIECRDASKRKLRGGSTNRRRATKFGCAYEPIRKRDVFERDGWRCYICGRETPKSLSGTKEPNAPELEHVVPLSKGGGHVLENVRCACMACNRAKGSRWPLDVIAALAA